MSKAEGVSYMVYFLEKNNKVIVNIDEDINFETAEKIEEHINKYEFPQEIEEVIVDLSKVRFIDSTGVSILIKWLHPISQQRKVSFEGSTKPIKNILKICKIDQFVVIN